MRLARSEYRCDQCPSVMYSAKEWEEHIKAHIRLHQIQVDLARYGLEGVAGRLGVSR